MLKLTYTSTGVTLERSVEFFEVAIRRRVLLGLRIGNPVGLEPTSISLLVKHSLPALKGLRGLITHTPTDALQLVAKGSIQVEIRLKGYWLTQQENFPGEGIFLTNTHPEVEGHLVQIWKSSHQNASTLATQTTPGAYS